MSGYSLEFLQSVLSEESPRNMGSTYGLDVRSNTAYEKLVKQLISDAVNKTFSGNAKNPEDNILFLTNTNMDTHSLLEACDNLVLNHFNREVIWKGLGMQFVKGELREDLLSIQSSIKNIINNRTELNDDRRASLLKNINSTITRGVGSRALQVCAEGLKNLVNEKGKGALAPRKNITQNRNNDGAINNSQQHTKW